MLIQETYIRKSMVRKDTQGISSVKKQERKWCCVAQSNLDKAEEFNRQFTDVFNKDEHRHFPLLDRSVPFMDYFYVSKEGVSNLLKLLPPPHPLPPKSYRT